MLLHFTLARLSFSHKPGCNSCVFAWKAFLTVEEHIQTDDQVLSTAKCAHVVDSRMKDHTDQWSRVHVNSYEDGKKRPTEASGLIYLTCQGQDPPKWGNMLTSLPGAQLVFSPLWTGSVDLRQGAQYGSSGQPFCPTFRYCYIIPCASWCFKMGVSFSHSMKKLFFPVFSWWL